MYKIGVTGPTGSGKSTFVELLAKDLSNCCIIYVDQIMKQGFNKYYDVLTDLLGPLESWPDGRVKTRNFNSTPERFSKSIEIIIPFMNKTLASQLNNLSDETNIVILDWAHLPILSVWDSIDKNYVISTMDDLRLQRLINRDVATGESSSRIKARMESTLLPTDKTEGTIILNDSSKEAFYDKVKQIKESLLKTLNEDLGLDAF